MKMSIKHLIATSLLLSGPVFAADCEMPAFPNLPEGASATMEEMITGQKAVKDFQSGAQAYRDCVDDTMEAMKAAAAEGDEAAVEKYKNAVEAYNGSVAAEEELAASFNAEIRAYKAAN